MALSKAVNAHEDGAKNLHRDKNSAIMSTVARAILDFMGSGSRWIGTGNNQVIDQMVNWIIGNPEVYNYIVRKVNEKKKLIAKEEAAKNPPVVESVVPSAEAEVDGPNYQADEKIVAEASPSMEDITDMVARHMYLRAYQYMQTQTEKDAVVQRVAKIDEVAQKFYSVNYNELPSTSARNLVRQQFANRLFLEFGESIRKTPDAVKRTVNECSMRLFGLHHLKLSNEQRQVVNDFYNKQQ